MEGVVAGIEGGRAGGGTSYSSISFFTSDFVSSIRFLLSSSILLRIQEASFRNKSLLRTLSREVLRGTSTCGDTVLIEGTEEKGKGKYRRSSQWTMGKLFRF